VFNLRIAELFRHVILTIANIANNYVDRFEHFRMFLTDLT